jgi:cytochrome c oxidase subunit 4
MEQNHNEEQHHQESAGYGIYILIWLGLVSLTVITVSLSGLNLHGLTVITALTIATVKSALVMNYFMHIKYETMIFKVFIAVCIIIFIVMIVLTFFDLTNRPIQQ